MCPFRGRRLPEIAAGDFFDAFNIICNMSSTRLLGGMPRDIDSSLRAALLQAFEHGRAHLLFGFTLKLASFIEPPALLFAGAHHKHHIARRALRICLERTDCRHPRVLELRQGVLGDAVREFLNGEDRSDKIELMVFLARLAFAYSSERRVEGGHATVHNKASNARRRAEAYDSLTLRMPEINAQLRKDSTFFNHLCSALDLCRSGHKVALELGFGRHPSMPLAKSTFDPIYRKIVYRADPASLYGKRPEIHVQGPGDDGDDEAVATDEVPEGAATDEVQEGAGPAAGQAADDMPPPDARAHKADADCFLSTAFYTKLKNDLALLHLESQSTAGGHDEWLYSLKTAGAEFAFSSLVSMLSPSTQSDGGVVIDLDKARRGPGQVLFFSLIFAKPHKKHRAARGGLSRGDLGIAVHKVLDKNDVHCTVALTPLVWTADEEVAKQAQLSSVVLSPKCLPAAALSSIRRWKVPLAYALKMEDRTMTRFFIIEL